jgi:uncharacterized protein (DUF927 family)
MTDGLNRDPSAPVPAADSSITERDTWAPILPAPLPLSETIRYRRLGAPSRVWEYRDAAGALLFLMARFDQPGERKQILPFTCGRDGWRWKAPPEPRPLYGLDRLAARPSDVVIVCEGEKVADAAGALFPDMVTLTWPGGAMAVNKADWSPLRGRRVTIWPDNDDPGRRAAAAVAKAARDVGAARVSVVQVPHDWPDRWDLADDPPEGATVDTLRAMLAEAEAEVQHDGQHDAQAEPHDVLPPNFLMTRNGLFLRQDDPEKPWVHVCGPLIVAAETRDADGRSWGVLLRWADREGREHLWAMPRAMLAGDGVELRAHLLDGGLFLGPSRKAREALMTYLAATSPGRFVRVVPRLGKHETPAGRVFVLPDRALGESGGEDVMLQTDRPDALPPLRQAGTLDQWKAEIAARAVGNSRLGFAIAAAFAAPLLALVGAEGGGFHMRGPSSIGKSTALHAAGSVWGGGGLRGWVRSWRTTDNALEAVAAAHCDLLLCLDEMSEAAPEAVAACAYALGNGMGKARAARDGSARRVADWLVLFLSTGEEGLAARLAEAKGGPRRVRAGQEVRILDVPADTRRHGLFEALHGVPDARALADALKAAAARYYGTAGAAWLELLARDPAGFAADAREVIETFSAAYVPPGADGQVMRAAQRFALVAAAGELAAGAGILPWPPGEAERAAAACFAAWLEARQGGDGRAEDAAAVMAVRDFLERHGDARFVPLSGEAEPDRPILNRAGWRRRAADGTWLYLILPGVWRSEVCAGLDPQQAARALMARGFLEPGDGKRATQKPRIPGIGPTRVYVVSASILAE